MHDISHALWRFQLGGTTAPPRLIGDVKRGRQQREKTQQPYYKRSTCRRTCMSHCMLIPQLIGSQHPIIMSRNYQEEDDSDRRWIVAVSLMVVTAVPAKVTP